jgi:hypothetical protein
VCAVTYVTDSPLRWHVRSLLTPVHSFDLPMWRDVATGWIQNLTMPTFSDATVTP